MSNWLKRLAISRVALVDRGANPDAHIALYKRDTMADEKEVVTPDQVATAIAKAVDEAQASVRAEFEKKLKAETDAREKAEKAAADNATAIAKIRQESRDREFVAKAALTPEWGEAKTFGPVLAKIEAALTPDEFKAFDTKLHAIHKQLDQSRLLTELGVQGETDHATPGAKLDSMAKGYMKDHQGVTYEAAYAAVCKTPDGAVLLSQSLRNEGK